MPKYGPVFEVEEQNLDCEASDIMIELLTSRGYTYNPKEYLNIGTYRKYHRTGHLRWRLSREDLWYKCTHLGIEVVDLGRYLYYLLNGVLNIYIHPPPLWTNEHGNITKIPDHELEILAACYDKHPRPLNLEECRCNGYISSGANNHLGIEGYEYDDDPDLWRHISVEQAYGGAGVDDLGWGGKSALSDLARVRRELRVRRV